jgi:hypothetical protein
LVGFGFWLRGEECGAEGKHQERDKRSALTSTALF